MTKESIICTYIFMYVWYVFKRKKKKVTFYFFANSIFSYPKSIIKFAQHKILYIIKLFI